MQSKKLLFFLLTATIMTVFPLTTYAQNNGEDDGEGIDLNYEQNDPNVGIRSGIGIPIDAFFSAEKAIVTITFFVNLGNVIIRLNNLTTGSTVSTVVDSSCGSCILPITGGSGLYLLEFLLSDGTRYYGYFLIP